MRIEIRRDTLANWTARNPTPAAGELCLDTTSQVIRVGDGTTAFLALPGFALDPTPAWSAWTDIPGAWFTAPVQQGTPTAQYRTGPGGQVQLRGQVTFSGAYTAGNVMIQFPVGMRQPASRPLTYSTRTLGTGAAATVLQVGDGVILPNAGALSSPATVWVAGSLVQLEGVTIFTN